MTAPPIPPVEKQLRTDCPPETAFRAFTEEIAAWWPAATHSLGGADKVERIVFERHVGGHIYELWKDGTRQQWGSILEWDPPRSVTFTWHVGRPADQASKVTLGFSADGEGSVVRLVHNEWEKFGVTAREIRDRYESGWGQVLGRRFSEYLAAR